MLIRRNTYSRFFICLSALWIALVLYIALRINIHGDDDNKRHFKIPHHSRNIVKLGLSNLSQLSTIKHANSSMQPLQTIEPYVTRKMLGEMAEAVIIDVNGLSIEEKQKYDEGWKNHAFNEYASNLISLRRSVPDIRDSRCPRQSNIQLPDASVIIIFHQEAWSTLLRTVHSVIDRSPRMLLKEIILVDDKSTFPHLQQPLEYYINSEFKEVTVKLIRMEERKGLIQARIRGAKAATGKVLIFLDSHCEAMPGWLEPLLEPIAIDSRIAVVPLIESINDKTLAIGSTKVRNAQIGGFDWGLIFRWYEPGFNRTKRHGADSITPLETPTMAGGLFAIDKNWFEKLGMYDPGMRIWGGENLEISFKVWMCGGRVVTALCSHVGHIFRTRSPYSWGTERHVLAHNLLRLAAVWMDDFAKFYIDHAPKDLVNVSFYGDLSEQIELRNSLQCHNFAWYRANVFPELFIPSEALRQGAIVNKAIDVCIDSPAKKADDKIMGFKCHGQKGNQLWYLSKEYSIRRDINCLWTAQSQINDGKIKIRRCPLDVYRLHQYQWNFTEGFIKSFISTDLCLELNVNNKDLFLNKCNETNLRQRWYWKDN